MSTRLRRTTASHIQSAADAKTAPNTWVTVGTYPALYTAQSMAHRVRIGRYAYAPAGAFQARVKPGDDGAELHVRYVGGERP